jgi:hypothetical protein
MPAAANTSVKAVSEIPLNLKKVGENFNLDSI